MGWCKSDFENRSVPAGRFFYSACRASPNSSHLEVMNLTPFFESAYTSATGRRKLGFLLRKGIPFNGPHKFKVDEIKPGFVACTAPFIRKNKNHLGGIHACCLATVSELSCGIALLSCLDAKKYRLIMQNMEVSYHYQPRPPSIPTSKSPWKNSRPKSSSRSRPKMQCWSALRSSAPTTTATTFPLLGSNGKSKTGTRCAPSRKRPLNATLNWVSLPARNSYHD